MRNLSSEEIAMVHRYIRDHLRWEFDDVCRESITVTKYGVKAKTIKYKNHELENISGSDAE